MVPGSRTFTFIKEKDRKRVLGSFTLTNFIEEKDRRRAPGRLTFTNFIK